jgi:hypothetical protein
VKSCDVCHGPLKPPVYQVTRSDNQNMHSTRPDSYFLAGCIAWIAVLPSAARRVQRLRRRPVPFLRGLRRGGHQRRLPALGLLQGGVPVQAVRLR